MKARGIAERFWEKVPTRPPSPELCWEWSAYKMKNGYGMISVARSRAELAHRVSWKITGSDIPDGMEIDHACHNRACVRPEHLSVVLSAYNSRQGGETKKRLSRCRNGHEYAVVGTYSHVNNSRRCRACHRINNRKGSK